MDLFVLALDYEHRRDNAIRSLYEVCQFRLDLSPSIAYVHFRCQVNMMEESIDSLRQFSLHAAFPHPRTKHRFPFPRATLSTRAGELPPTALLREILEERCFELAEPTR